MTAMDESNWLERWVMVINEGDGRELCVSTTGEGEYQGRWARVVNKGGSQEPQMKAMDEGKGFYVKY